MPALRKIKPNTAKGWDHPPQALAFPYRCAALLRLADALDREHRQTVRWAHSNIQKETLHPVLAGEGAMLWKGWAVTQRADRFQRTFVLPGKGFTRERGAA